MRRHRPEEALPTLPEVEVDDGEEADLEEVGLDEEEGGAEAPETNAATGGPGNV